MTTKFPIYFRKQIPKSILEGRGILEKECKI
jgi:hypothetical protein